CGVLELEMVPGDVRGPVRARADRAQRRRRLAERAEVPGLVDGLVGRERGQGAGRRRGVQERTDLQGLERQPSRIPSPSPGPTPRASSAGMFENDRCRGHAVPRSSGSRDRPGSYAGRASRQVLACEEAPSPGPITQTLTMIAPDRRLVLPELSAASTMM